MKVKKLVLTLATLPVFLLAAFSNASITEPAAQPQMANGLSDGDACIVGDPLPPGYTCVENPNTPGMGWIFDQLRRLAPSRGSRPSHGQGPGSEARALLHPSGAGESAVGPLVWRGSAGGRWGPGSRAARAAGRHRVAVRPRERDRVGWLYPGTTERAANADRRLFAPRAAAGSGPCRTAVPERAGARPRPGCAGERATRGGPRGGRAHLGPRHGGRDPGSVVPDPRARARRCRAPRACRGRRQFGLALVSSFFITSTSIDTGRVNAECAASTTTCSSPCTSGLRARILSATDWGSASASTRQ